MGEFVVRADVYRPSTYRLFEFEERDHFEPDYIQGARSPDIRVYDTPRDETRTLDGTVGEEEYY
jgi:hypothetical protein